MATQSPRSTPISLPLIYQQSRFHRLTFGIPIVLSPIVGPHPKKTVLTIFYREKTAMRAWFSIMRPVVWCYFVIRPVDRVMQQ